MKKLLVGLLMAFSAVHAVACGENGSLAVDCGSDDGLILQNEVPHELCDMGQCWTYLADQSQFPKYSPIYNYSAYLLISLTGSIDEVLKDLPDAKTYCVILVSSVDGSRCFKTEREFLELIFQDRKKLEPGQQEN